MTTIYDIHSYKGGTGVTTTACATAMALAKNGRRTLLVNAQPTDDVSAWMAYVTQDAITTFRENLDHFHTKSGDFMRYFHHYDDIVIDNGRNTAQTYDTVLSVVRVCVVRNDYMTLRNTVGKYQSDKELLVLFFDNARVLSVRDVADVLGSQPIVAKLETDVQRSIDAGMASTRDHFGWADEITEGGVAS